MELRMGLCVHALEEEMGFEPGWPKHFDHWSSGSLPPSSWLPLLGLRNPWISIWSETSGPQPL